MADATDDVMVSAILAALRPLENIANAYDANELDNEARKNGKWGMNTTPHDQIELYSGRGGKTLLTLAHAMQARELCIAIRKIAVVGAATREVFKGDRS